MAPGWQVDSLHVHAFHARDAIVLGQPLIEKSEVGGNEVGQRQIAGQ